MDYFQYFSHKIICCGCVLESPLRGDSNIHRKHMFFGELMIIKVNTLFFLFKLYEYGDVHVIFSQFDPLLQVFHIK